MRGPGCGAHRACGLCSKMGWSGAGTDVQYILCKARRCRRGLHLRIATTCVVHFTRWGMLVATESKWKRREPYTRTGGVDFWRAGSHKTPRVKLASGWGYFAHFLGFYLRQQGIFGWWMAQSRLCPTWRCASSPTWIHGFQAARRLAETPVHTFPRSFLGRRAVINLFRFKAMLKN